jgi:uncharacterized protein (TIGR02284 family)
METTEKSIEVLNDLIQINHDRVKGFENALKDLKGEDTDLQGIFENGINESNLNVQELSTAVAQAGGQPETGSSSSGAIHRTWLSVKATFTGHDRKSILDECERGEDAIKKAYRDALEPDSSLTADQVQLVTRQQQDIIASHDRIKALRDSNL